MSTEVLSGRPLLFQAIHDARTLHADQRYGLEPYMYHLRGVAWFLWGEGYHQPEVIAAAFLHDSIEDIPGIDEAWLRRRGYPEVSILGIAGVTYDDDAAKERLSKTEKAKTNPVSHVTKWGDVHVNKENTLATIKAVRQQGMTLAELKAPFATIAEAEAYLAELSAREEELLQGLPTPAQVDEFIANSRAQAV